MMYTGSFTYKDSEVCTYDTNICPSVSDSKCPICNELIQSGETLTCLLNNHKYIPNVVVHRKCFYRNKVVDSVKCIEDKYIMYKDLQDIFR